MKGEPAGWWSLQRRVAWAPATVVLGSLLLAAGAGAGPERRAEAAAGEASDAASTSLAETDLEAPDVFQVTDQGLWDGRPSLGGVWVAHPDVADPERVVIRNRDNGEVVIGALFRRERDNPGPPIQVSSDAAEALGLLAGAPATLEVTALRREEAAEPAPAETPAEAVGERGDLGADGAEDLAAPEADPSSDGAMDAAAPASSDPGAAEAVSRATAAILEGSPPPSMPFAFDPASTDVQPGARALAPETIAKGPSTQLASDPATTGSALEARQDRGGAEGAPGAHPVAS